MTSFLVSVFQFSYTTVFGMYSAFLFVKTGQKKFCCSLYFLSFTTHDDIHLPLFQNSINIVFVSSQTPVFSFYKVKMFTKYLALPYLYLFKDIMYRYITENKILCLILYVRVLVVLSWVLYSRWKFNGKTYCLVQG